MNCIPSRFCSSSFSLTRLIVLLFGGGGGDGGEPPDCMFTSIGEKLAFGFAFACVSSGSPDAFLILPTFFGKVVVVAFGGVLGCGAVVVFGTSGYPFASGIESPPGNSIGSPRPWADCLIPPAPPP